MGRCLLTAPSRWFAFPPPLVILFDDLTSKPRLNVPLLNRFGSNGAFTGCSIPKSASNAAFAARNTTGTQVGSLTTSFQVLALVDFLKTSWMQARVAVSMAIDLREPGVAMKCANFRRTRWIAGAILTRWLMRVSCTATRANDPFDWS